MSEINSELEQELPTETFDQPVASPEWLKQITEEEAQAEKQKDYDQLMIERMNRVDEENLRRWCVETGLKTVEATKQHHSEREGYLAVHADAVLDYADKIYNFIKNEKILTNNEV